MNCVFATPVVRSLAKRRAAPSAAQLVTLMKMTKDIVLAKKTHSSKTPSTPAPQDQMP